MKILFICKKHYKQLMEEFKTTNSSDAVDNVLTMPNVYWNLRGFDGIDVQIRITPYLKRILLVDTDYFGWVHAHQ